MSRKAFFLACTWFLISAFFGMGYAAPFPDTGQTKCYDNDSEIPCPAPGEPFYGQDAQYPRLPRSYTKLGYGGVELPDTATQAQGWLMTRDNVTGLIWEIKTEANKDDTYTWGEEFTFIGTLNSAQFGGFLDWRLPNVKELSSLVNSGIPFPGPTIDVMRFPHTVSSGYYASSFVVGFDYGAFVGWGATSDTYYVRAVRGTPIPGPVLVDHGDGTLADTTTGLMWHKDTAPGRYIWQEALAYCEALDLADYTDWRLPNRNELQSLVDYSWFNPAIDPALAPNTVSSDYWSSTTFASPGGFAWPVHFGAGSLYYGLFKFVGCYVRCVRAGQTNSLGSLQVFIHPPRAAHAGMQWRRIGTETWRDSGHLEPNVPAWQQKIEFSTTHGWQTPDPVVVSVIEGDVAEHHITAVRSTVFNPAFLLLLMDE